MTGFILLTLILTLATQPAGEGAQSDRYSVETLDTGGGNRAARVIISNRVTSRRHMISINGTLGALRRTVIREDQERVLFICENGFVVVDPTGHVPADEVYAVDAVAAPGGRWIAYRRFFPSTHPGPSDGIALYDTHKSPEQNHSAHPVTVEREWRAGWPVFPPASEWNDASRVTAPGDAYVLSSSLAWEGGKTPPALVFSMRRADQDTVVLAVPGTSAPRVCWSKLPGDADRWRVKTINLSAVASGAHQVRIASGAVQNAENTTIDFPAHCAGPTP